MAASYGHVRDLPMREMGIDIENNFEPNYEITKPKVVAELRKLAKGSKKIVLAMDQDREGEGIAAGLIAILRPKIYERVTYTEISKTAIENALQNPRRLDENLVFAQETRRILDRLAGYLLSPLVRKAISGGRSAGRVQSVAVKLVVEKEREIEAHMEESYFKVTADFYPDGGSKKNLLPAVLHQMGKTQARQKRTAQPLKGGQAKIEDMDQMREMLELFKESVFTVASVHEKTGHRNPSAPFITSSLQQEAANKFGFSVDRTMSLAQKLYEGGHITYMRTDSTVIAADAMKDIKNYVVSNYGKNYYNKRVYKTKSKSAQEAHEAIRPTKINNTRAMDGDYLKLYSLIWKRTVASQMSPAEIRTLVVQVLISNVDGYFFQASFERVAFDGFLRVYNVDVQDSVEAKYVPEPGNRLLKYMIKANQEFSKPPTRYTQALLVKKMEELGIGRPATYASIVAKVTDETRRYVVEEDIPGVTKEAIVFSLDRRNDLQEETVEKTVGNERKKFRPTEVGIQVTNYLERYFDFIMQYEFTANMEDKLDDIATGKKIWHVVLDNFYRRLEGPLNAEMDRLREQTGSPGKKLGQIEGKDVMLKETRKGWLIIYNKKPYTLSDELKQLDPDTLTLEQVMPLLQYPKLLGRHNRKQVWLHQGRENTYYLKYDGKNYSIRDHDPTTLTLEQAVQIMDERVKAQTKNVIQELKDGKKTYTILQGPYGPYIAVKSGAKKFNVKVPSQYDPANLTLELVEKIIKSRFDKKKSRKGVKENEKPAT